MVAVFCAATCSTCEGCPIGSVWPCKGFRVVHWLCCAALCCAVQCIYRLEHEGWDFLFHGVFCFLVFSNLTYTGNMHFYGE